LLELPYTIDADLVPSAHEPHVTVDLKHEILAGIELLRLMAGQQAPFDTL
jgi:hypothetical protein